MSVSPLHIRVVVLLNTHSMYTRGGDNVRYIRFICLKKVNSTFLQMTNLKNSFRILPVCVKLVCKRCEQTVVLAGSKTKPEKNKGSL